MSAEPPVLSAPVGGGVSLTYVEAGAGPPVIFVHGSLSDLTYWEDQIGPFSARHRVIAYSRRYNPPNHNRPIAGYSAVTDADDLAALIGALGAGPAHIVGHSYGAFAALFLASRRPELVRTLTLAEGPAVTLLQHVTGPRAGEAQAAYAEIQRRMVAPMIVAFQRGDREAGVRTFIDYVKGPGAWAGFSAADKAAALAGAGEWDVMMTHGTLFPDLDPAAVGSIRAPTLLISGDRSYPFLGLIHIALRQLLPDCRSLVVPRADHQMWLEAPEACRHAALALIDA
jgi:pimeloyl-ACP methyl ester carboxylesterase